MKFRLKLCTSTAFSSLVYCSYNEEELHNLQDSPIIIMVITSRRINAYRVLVGKPEGRDHSENLGVDGKMSEWIIKKWGGKVCT